ncbi:hypothetical protein RYX36_012671 [Vicia faba]
MYHSNEKLSSKVDHIELLPRKFVDNVPISKSQIPSLIQLFSLTKDSPKGEDMKDIINHYEFKPTNGETKEFPHFLEFMLEFIHSVIDVETNYNIHATSYPTTSGACLQNYTILDIYASKWVACHPRPYP